MENLENDLFLPNGNLPISEGYKTDEVSLTVPGMAPTVQEILKRYYQGTLDGVSVRADDEESDFEDLSALDRPDVDIVDVQYEFDDYRTKIQQQKQKQTVQKDQDDPSPKNEKTPNGSEAEEK